MYDLPSIRLPTSPSEPPHVLNVVFPLISPFITKESSLSSINVPPPLKLPAIVVPGIEIRLSTVPVGTSILLIDASDLEIGSKVEPFTSFILFMPLTSTFCAEIPSNKISVFALPSKYFILDEARFFPFIFIVTFPVFSLENIPSRTDVFPSIFNLISP